MIVTSKINDIEYFYIKIPRTATVSYERLFFPDIEPLALHMHHLYYEYKHMPGFTVIRNPVTRFISGLHQIRKLQLNPQLISDVTHTYDVKQNKISFEDYKVRGTNFTDIFQSEDFFYDFFYTSFYKNCEPKCVVDYNFLTNLRLVFDTDGRVIPAFFITQVRWAYFPQVQIFRYENLTEFNAWIEQELGYDTSTLKRLNASDGNGVGIDVTSNKFKELTKYLFYDDFKYFNYEFPI